MVNFVMTLDIPSELSVKPSRSFGLDKNLYYLRIALPISYKQKAKKVKKVLESIGVSNYLCHALRAIRFCNIL